MASGKRKKRKERKRKKGKSSGVEAAFPKVEPRMESAPAPGAAAPIVEVKLEPPRVPEPVALPPATVANARPVIHEHDHPHHQHHRKRKRAIKNFRTVAYQVVKLCVLLFIVSGSLIGATSLRSELITSHLQSQLFTSLSHDLTFALTDGPSAMIRFPHGGPYFDRLGYSALPKVLPRLRRKGFRIVSQATISKRHAEYIDRGIYPIYRAKTQTGLQISDRTHAPLFSSVYPTRVYASFSSIPKLVLDTLLFIEDRNLLDESQPRHNPAVEWDRFGKAILDLLVKFVDKSHDVQGGSTIATQLEKFRYSAEGRTTSPKQKLQQMFSASLRAYRDGPDTVESRKRIALDYINSVPLAAVPKFGEITGLGDGLWAYFGQDFDTFNSLLRQPLGDVNSKLFADQVAAFRQMMSLFLAHRRPTDYLGSNPKLLEDQIQKYLPALYNAGIIPASLVEQAAIHPITFRRQLPQPPRISFLDRKGITLIRSYLQRTFGLKTLYELDRYDLTVDSTLDNHAQQEVTLALRKLQDRKAIQELGLEGFRLLSGDGDLSKVLYSFTLYERGADANYLRVQTDNLDQPFNINEGVKLDLGSTAKLRTTVTYLDLLSDFYQQFSNSSPAMLDEALKGHTDPISQWGLTFLKEHPQATLKEFLSESLERKYSASPGESFFTGGGLHTFENFNKDDNGKVLSIRMAIRNSVNLPFVRLMRDIVRYYALHVTGSSAKTLSTMESENRQYYLSIFADREGAEFLRRFYSKYKGKSPREIMQILLEGVHSSPKRFAAVFWFLKPEAPESEFAEFMKQNFPDNQLSFDDLLKLHEMYSVRAQSTQDRGYLAQVHPLELWLAAYLYEHNKASFADALEASKTVRQEVYEWLFNTKHRSAQDSRIRMIMEQEAFSEIHRQWQKMGYPLQTLVPSLATALGTSADRPDALAEFMGILVNDGKRKPQARVTKLHFAADTPFETILEYRPRNAEQVIAPEVAAAAKELLLDIVQNGTAVRIKNGLGDKETRLMVGGKTGTGDHRFEVYGKGGVIKESRVVNRTATFVFMIGDRFFGTITAFVHGPSAASFKFTSALPVQLLKGLEPALAPLLVEGAPVLPHGKR